MPEELLKQRAEYLRQQRDKLVEAKHRQREKQLIEAAQRNAAERPRTSQVSVFIEKERKSNVFPYGNNFVF